MGIAGKGNGAVGLTIRGDGEVTVVDGNLVIGTAGHGINFSADGENTVGTPHQTLDDYERGDRNPTENNGVTLTDNHTARYVKIGQMVHLYFDVTVSLTLMEMRLTSQIFPTHLLIVMTHLMVGLLPTQITLAQKYAYSLQPKLERHFT